jgi:glucose/arabinose dehydrogenase
VTIIRKDDFGMMPTRIQVIGFVVSLTVLQMAAQVSAQNLFVSVYTNGSSSIDEFTPQGGGSVFASGLNVAFGLTFDSQGNLYAATEGNNTITKITPDGVQSTFASGGLDGPYDLTFYNGDLYESDYGSSYVYQYTMNGSRSAYASATGPTALAFDSSGDFYLVQGANSTIYEFKTNGTYGTIGSGFVGPSALAFDSAGDLFVSDTGHGNIVEITSSGTQSVFASGLDRPWGLAFDSAGDLFEADAGSGNIYEFLNNDGTLSSDPITFASGLGDPLYLAFQPVPEPSFLSILAVGGVAFWAKRRKNR